MILNNEYKEIFELNNKSLLFTRVASDEIKEGNLEKALSILEDGIELLEDYPTPFFLMGNLFIKLGKIEEAEKAFQKGNSLLNNLNTLNYYLSLIPDSVEYSINDADLEKSEKSDDQLVDLADKLHDAKIEINLENDSTSYDENKNDEDYKPLKGLVSETLASIYINQSNYKEAKAIYETLIDIQPEREEYFNKKLSEIDSKMRTRKLEND